MQEAVSADWELPIGSHVSDYEIRAVLGRGGTSIVYRAVRLGDGVAVALKLLRPEFRLDPTYRGRLERESVVLQKLRHPNLLEFYEFGESSSLLFVAMEYVAGISLRQMLQLRSRLSVADSLKIFLPLLEGLEAAHRQDILHRDLKPENVLITDDGEVKVSDFGCAKGPGLAAVTAEGVVLGTPTYMAPEHFRAKHTALSDQYSAGIVIFEMLTGRVPFLECEPLALAMAHVGKKPPNPRQVCPDVPEKFADTILKALAKVPEQRHASVADFANALKSQ